MVGFVGSRVICAPFDVIVVVVAPFGVGVPRDRRAGSHGYTCVTMQDGKGCVF